MATDVTMPRLSDSMEEGTVLKWLIDQGGEVKRGEPLVEIETDKANMTYDADTDGVLVEIVAQEGDTLAIGDVIARIGEPGEVQGDGKPRAADEAEAGADEAAEAAGAEEAEEAGAEAEAEQEGAEAEAGEKTEEAGDEAAARGEARGAAGAEAGGGETQAGDGPGTTTRERRPAGDGDGRVKASPVARRMARELGVELAQLEGSGPAGSSRRTCKPPPAMAPRPRLSRRPRRSGRRRNLLRRSGRRRSAPPSRPARRPGPRDAPRCRTSPVFSRRLPAAWPSPRPRRRTSRSRSPST
jgi:pyruvate dehydrogenase E2 component (dihydrolipoamide acetyltransferase)